MLSRSRLEDISYGCVENTSSSPMVYISAEKERGVASVLNGLWRYFHGLAVLPPSLPDRPFGEFRSSRRPFSLEFDGIVKIFAKPANWPQNAVPLRAANFMCWFYGLSSEFYVRYQMLPRIHVACARLEIEEIRSLRRAAFIEAVATLTGKWGGRRSR